MSETKDTLSKPEAESAGPSPEMLQEMVAFLKLAGQAVSHAGLYGTHHKLTARSLSETFAQLEKLLARQPRINLSLVDGQLLVEGKPPEQRNPFIVTFVNKLVLLRVLGFSLIQGLQRSEFNKLMDVVMTAKDEAEEDFATRLEREGLEHIRAERVKYERITRDTKDAPPEKPTQIQPVAAAIVEQIMAFLKGEAAVRPDQISKELADLASDPERLASLIMEAVAIRQQQTMLAEGETLADIVVGCLRRTFEGLVRDPSARTKKGKAAIKKVMLMLEKKVLDKLHALAPGPDPALDEAVASAIEEMNSDLEVDNLTTEYMQKRKAMQKTEERVLRYLKSHADDEDMKGELAERLTEAGLTPDGWRELVVKSARTAGGGMGTLEGGAVAGGSDPVSLGVLAMLLSELDNLMSGVANPRAIGAKLTEMGEKAQAFAQTAEERIRELGKAIEEGSQALSGMDEAHRAQASLSRNAMMNLLAEIVQELSQFLSAINCAVSMTLAGHIGAINEDQQQVLGVAENCGRRLEQLLSRMLQIVGLPKGLHPDKDSVYSGWPPPAPQT